MYGFVKVGAAVPKVRVADCKYNTVQVIEKVKEAWAQSIQVLVFPELVITGYTCGDLFFQKTLLNGAMRGLEEILAATKEMEMLIAVGMPIAMENEIFNCSVMIFEGKILGIVPKQFIPNYNEFYERRWFAAGGSLKCKQIEILGQEVAVGCDLLFKLGEAVTIGVEMCEDVWVPIPPSSVLCMEGAELILNLSASNEIISKRSYRQQLISQQSARCICGYIYASAGIGESTTDLVFSGHSMICENGMIKAENEKLIDGDYLLVTEIDVERLQAERQKCKSFKACAKAYSKEMRIIKAVSQKLDVNEAMSQIERKGTLSGETKPSYNIARKPFVPHNKLTRDERCKEIFALQVAGLKGRLLHTRSKRVVLGISGGLDSTLALLVCGAAFEELGWDKKGIVGVTMPGFGTTDRTYDNAMMLMKALGITIREIPIGDACMQHFKDIGHDSNVHNVLYENVQARERTKILMDVANQGGGFVVGTGDLSELALGWCTYNGDHMSMYAVNASVPKTLIRSLVGTIAKEQEELVKNVLKDIIETPVSPELLPASSNGEIVQKTEEVVGPYELHDFYLYYMIRFGFSPSKIFYLAKQAFKEKEDEIDCVYSDKEILKWMKTFYNRFFKQQFKRSCLPDGPKVGSICLSPRGDWRMPSDAQSTLWLEEIEKLERELTQEVIKYNIKWLQDACHKGDSFEYQFFWGHTPREKNVVDKSCLSQWWLCKFEVEGVIYSSAEQYMMAGKAKLFKDEEIYTQILTSSDPKEIKALGRRIKNFQESVWKAHCIEIVLEGNRAKFGQNPELKAFLIQTGDKVIAEASPVDKIWGIGLKEQDQAAREPDKWQGTNWLGFALMEVREELVGLKEEI